MSQQAVSAVTPCLPEWGWVREFLCNKFPSNSLTLRNQLAAWRVWESFLIQNNITRPTEFKRELAHSFIKWRFNNGITRVTTITNIHSMHAILSEAVLRELCDKNPLRALGLSRGPIPEKPEITPEVEQEIRDAIERDTTKHKDFLRISMELGIYQARRIAETRLPLNNVDFERNTIRFFVKGGRWHIQPMHPRCRAIMLALKEAGREWTFDHPTNPEVMSRVWWVFWRRHGFAERFPKICHHSFRVTCTSRLARAGVPLTKALKFVGHGSFGVHQIYLRLTVEDLNECVAALR